MSAFLAILHGDTVTLYSDRGWWDPAGSGRLTALRTKLWHLGRGSAVMTGRGSGLALHSLVDALSTLASFDEIVEGGLHAAMQTVDRDDWEICIVGWSAKRDRAESYIAFAHGEYGEDAPRRTLIGQTHGSAAGVPEARIAQPAAGASLEAYARAWFADVRSMPRKPGRLPVAAGGIDFVTVRREGTTTAHSLVEWPDAIDAGIEPATLMQMKFPLGAALGKFWVHQVQQDGSGGHTLSFDPVVFVGEPPVIDEDPGVLTILDCEIISMSPPKAIATVRGSGDVEIGSPRTFGISPPVDGKTLWNLDSDGPCVIEAPGTYQITPLGTYLDAYIDLWGPGGSTGSTYYRLGSANSNYDAAGGTNTQLTVPSGTNLVARAGSPSSGHKLVNATPNSGNMPSQQPSGGTASGGDDNDNGSAGSRPTTNNFSVYGGTGAAAPQSGSPGGGGSKGFGSVSSPGVRNGVAGEEFGGGAAGASTTEPGPAPTNYWGATSGGGSGAHVGAQFNNTTRVLSNGVAYQLVIGAAGSVPAAVDETGNALEVATGAMGAPGGAVIT